MENKKFKIGAWGSIQAEEGSCLLCDVSAILEDDTAFLLPVVDWKIDHPVVDWNSTVFVPVCRKCFEAAWNGR